jgi:pimeloyl-ACP methyl ester carboxylesterase
VGASSGEAPDSITGMAQIAADFIGALGHSQVDVLGWSMGGAVAQRLTIDHPHLVRRLVLTATGPGAVPDAPPPVEKAFQVAAKPVNDDEDFLYLFFTGTDQSRSAGLASLRRLDERLTASRSTVKAATVQAQLAAIRGWVTGKDSSADQLDSVTIPVLVANGTRDVMVHAYGSYVLSQRLPDAHLILYPDAGHAFLFQYPERFGEAVLQFLR